MLGSALGAKCFRVFLGSITIFTPVDRIGFKESVECVKHVVQMRMRMKHILV